MADGMRSWEYEGTIYLNMGLIHIWNHKSDRSDWGRDPPRFNHEFRKWCADHGLKDQLDRAERTGNCEFKFTDRDLFMLFKLTWFE